MTTNKHPTKLMRYVLLEGVKQGQRFFTAHNPHIDPTKLHGETCYRVIGYAESIDEAQHKLLVLPYENEWRQEKAEMLGVLETISTWLIAPDLSQETLDKMNLMVSLAIGKAKSIS